MAKYYVDVDSDGDIFWYKDQEMKITHRDGGPAIEIANGYKAWYIDGERHREDGPAIEYPDGSKIWYKNGLLHREDGPAIEIVNGSVQYWLKGRHLTKKKWEAALRPHEELTVGQIEQLLGKRIKIIK